MKNILIVAFIISMLISGQVNSQNFDRKSIISDLEFLYHSLENTHYDLYAYTDKEQFNSNYLDVKK